MRKWFGIFTSGFLASGLCWDWYSVRFFRKAWLAGQWIKAAKIEAQIQADGLKSTWFFTVCAFIVLSLGIFYFIKATRCATFVQTVCTVFVLWFLIAVPLLFLDMLWEFRRHDLFYLDSLFLLVVFMLIACVNHFFSKDPGHSPSPVVSATNK